MVPANVIQKRIGRNREYSILQVFQVMHTSYLFFRFRIAKHKIAKAEMLGNRLAQFKAHLLRVFVDELGMDMVGKLPVRDFGRL